VLGTVLERSAPDKHRYASRMASIDEPYGAREEHGHIAGHNQGDMSVFFKRLGNVLGGR
jgi:hypothetical protein